MNLTWTVDSTPPTATVRLVGDLDFVTTNDLVDALCRLLAEERAIEQLRLDCSELAFCDSSGLSGLLTVHNESSSAGVVLCLDERRSQLDRLLQLTGTYEHLAAPCDQGLATSSE